ncbi:MAG TPA: S9 family peptidase [Nevskiaceae bacterium]|nr:S9 family peptidase [Nevskiaceae bacterium]
MRVLTLLGALWLAGCAGLQSPGPAFSSFEATAPQPPLAVQKPHTVASPHGDREDPWYWLRDDARQNPEMLAYLEAENRYAEAMTAGIAPLSEQLFQELRGRIQEDDASVPYLDNGYWYYQRYEKGQERPIHARRKGSLEAPEEILLDANQLAGDSSYYQLAYYVVSPDNRWIAWTEDRVGRRQFTLRIKNLETGEVLPDQLHPVQGDIAWLNDNRSLLYIETDPVTLLGYRVRAHQRGQAMADNSIVYTETDKSYYLGLNRSKSDRHVYIYCSSTLTSEQLYASADGLPLTLRSIAGRSPGHLYDAQHLPGRGAGEFVIRSNENAPNYRLVRAPVKNSGERRRWKDLVAHREDAFIQGYELFRTHLAINERSEGLLKIRLKPWKTGAAESRIEAAEPAYVMSLVGSADFDSPSLRYVYESMTTPDTTIDYDLASGEKTVRKVEPVLGDFDPARYVTEYRHATARDGTRVPVSLVYRKDLPRDGRAPLYQYAYGSYGYPMDPGFSANRLSLLDRGFVYAIAHVRGGQELGRRWYEDGKLLKKMNTFTDFIDVTDFLVAEGYAARDRVFAQGGSAGGLLMGAIANLAPEKYRMIAAHVPFVDVVTTMLDESIPLTTNEFDEWGNPKEKVYYDYLLSYSPYDNVAPRDYPALYVTTGLWDSQVQYFEPAKWVAKLRRADTSAQTPILFRVQMQAGHGGKSGRFERLREIADEYALVLKQAGLAP